MTMGIRDLLAYIGANYDKELGIGSDVPAQRRLREAPKLLADRVSSDLLIKARGGQGSATWTPWIGFFDQREQASSHEGLYVIYIFSADMRTVFLILNQGVSDLKERFGIDGAVQALRESGKNILRDLPDDLVSRWRDPVDLKAGTSWRQRAYVAGAVLAKAYDIASLPAEAELRADLRDMLDLYRIAIALEDRESATPGARDANAARYTALKAVDDRRPQFFKPKDSSDYRVFLKGREISKTRQHERLINEFVEHVRNLGFRPATVGASPRDLVMYRDEGEWLVEAKQVVQGNPRDSVRQAIGQLLEYRFCLYGSQESPHMVALFSEDIGNLFRDLLETIEIGAIWRTADGSWSGSARAKSWGLTNA